MSLPWYRFSRNFPWRFSDRPRRCKHEKISKCLAKPAADADVELCVSHLIGEQSRVYNASVEIAELYDIYRERVVGLTESINKMAESDDPEIKAAVLMAKIKGVPEPPKYLDEEIERQQVSQPKQSWGGQRYVKRQSRGQYRPDVMNPDTTIIVDETALRKADEDDFQRRFAAFKAAKLKEREQVTEVPEQGSGNSGQGLPGSGD